MHNVTWPMPWGSWGGPELTQLGGRMTPESSLKEEGLAQNGGWAFQAEEQLEQRKRHKTELLEVRTG